MADVAMLLHWPPATMHPMELGELMHWQALAIDRFQQMNTTKS